MYQLKYGIQENGIEMNGHNIYIYTHYNLNINICGQMIESVYLEIGYESLCNSSGMSSNVAIRG